VSRLGLIVGKRHAKRAVDRKRIKRMLRESFRLGHEQLTSLDVVVQLDDSAPRTWLEENSNTLGPPLRAALAREQHEATSP
jgi:ribonuclease P protein component